MLCQRCGRTICPECQTQAAVGVHCPECVREARASAPRQPSRIRNLLRPGGTQPVVTWSIIALCVLVYIAEIIPGSPVYSLGAFASFDPYATAQPWRMVTSIFLHSPNSVLHILFNMLTLFLFGPMMEQMLGRGRFLALFLVTGFGGSVAVLLLAPGIVVVGASGAIFGLLGALVVIQRGLGGNPAQLLVVIGLNLAIGFFPGAGIAWQAHLGGVIIGALVGLVYVRTRRRDQQRVQMLAIGGIAAALVVVTIIKLYVL